MIQNKIFVALAALFFLGMMSIFTVSDSEKAIKFHSGKIVKDDYQPGVYLKWPFLDRVKKFDARIQTVDSQPERFSTAENKDVIVDFYVQWQMLDVKKLYSKAGDINQTNLELERIIKETLQREFAKLDIKQLLSSDRAIIKAALEQNAEKVAADFGVKLIDVRIKHIDLPEDLRKSVLSQMEAEQTKLARETRAQGAKEAEQIRAQADKQRIVSLANAVKEAETLRGEGDAKAAEIYATAYGADVEFFSFYRSMNAYKAIFSDSKDMIVVEPDSDFFKYFKKQK